jgi:hypothetical protein
VVFGHLGDLEQPQLAFVVDQRTSLDDWKTKSENILTDLFRFKIKVYMFGGESK